MAILKIKDFKVPGFIKDALVGVLIALSAILFLFISAVVVPKIVHYHMRLKHKRAKELKDKEASEKQTTPERSEESDSSERRSRSNIDDHIASKIRETKDDHLRRGRCPIPRPPQAVIGQEPTNFDMTRFQTTNHENMPKPPAHTAQAESL
ncbi:hypothetical protein AA313_de0204536 [Arthrobotrys entomopaga]|nr:hypothetical protein AA313_de0204536 [Arthrobotrys entomopaga]